MNPFYKVKIKCFYCKTGRAGHASYFRQCVTALCCFVDMRHSFYKCVIKKKPSVINFQLEAPVGSIEKYFFLGGGGC